MRSSASMAYASTFVWENFRADILLAKRMSISSKVRPYHNHGTLAFRIGLQDVDMSLFTFVSGSLKKVQTNVKKKDSGL